jgi:hypothetical protein
VPSEQHPEREHDYEPESPEETAPANAPDTPGEANPNAGGPQRLQGDMGVSSERPGPLGGDRSTDRGIEGTGTTFATAANTSGEMETFPGGADLPDSPERRPQSSEDRPADEGKGSGVDRTVGEDNPAEVPPQAHDPKRNPGHSHGT